MSRDQAELDDIRRAARRDADMTEACDRPMPVPENCCMGRMPAKELLRQRARDLRHQASQLDALCEQLPEKLTPAADEALWALVTSAR